MTDPYDIFFNRLRPGRFLSQWDPNWVPQQGEVGGDQIGTYGFIEDGSVDTAQLDDGAVTDVKISDATISAQKFASTLAVPQLVDSLPALPDADYPPDASLVFLSTNGKLYRNFEDDWTVEVESDDIVSISADKITAGSLAAAVILSGYIATASSGTRVEFDSDGIRAYNDTTLIVNIPTDALSDVYFKAVIQALGLTVTGDASFEGAGNEITTGGVLVAQAGLSSPVAAPSLSQGWLDAHLMAHQAGYSPRGGLEYTAAGGADGATKVFYSISRTFTSSWKYHLIERLASTGAVNRTKDLATELSVAVNAAVHGSYVYVLGRDPSTGYVRVSRYLLSTLAVDASYTVATANLPYGYIWWPVLGSDGTYLYIADSGADGGALKWCVYNDTMVKQGSTVTSAYGPAGTVEDIYVGSADYGAWRLVAVSRLGDEAHAFSSTGVHQTDDCYPIPNSDGRGVTYGDALADGARFWTWPYAWSDDPTVTFGICKHTTWNWTSASSIYWIAYSWYDSVGTSETLVSPRTSITMGKRKRLLVTTPTEPGAGGSDEPDGRRIYAYPNASAPATTLLDLQATTSDESYYLDDYDSGGAAPPVSNDFPGGTPAEIKSADDGWTLKGDGLINRTGTAFPASPDTNDQFWRSDLGTEFFYDGTRWLSTQLFSAILPITHGDTLPITASTTALERAGRFPLNGGSGIYYEDWVLSFYVSGGTALSGSHKWVGTWISQGENATIATQTINSGSSSTWRESIVAVNAVADAADFGPSTTWTKTGTPGGLYPLSYITYRIIAT